MAKVTSSVTAYNQSLIDDLNHRIHEIQTKGTVKEQENEGDFLKLK